MCIGYVPDGVLRLYKSQLDGANEDDRFADDFFIDLIFAPIEKAPLATTSNTTTSSGEGVSGGGAGGGGGGSIMAVGAPSDSGLVIEASSADRYVYTCI